MAINRNIDGADSDNSSEFSGKNSEGSESSRARVSTSKKVKGRGRGLIAILIILVLALAALSAYLFQQLNIIKKNPNKVAQDQTQAIVAKVSKLIVLPAEAPTIATVNDLSALKGQSFFDNAKLGDIILIYFGAKKAVLYRESENKIIEVAPVSDIPPANTTTPAPTPAKTTTPTKAASSTSAQ